MSQFTKFENQNLSDPTSIQTKRVSRQEYNRIYYQKSKERREKKKKHSVAKVFQLFARGDGSGLSGFNRTRAVFRWLEVLVLISLSFIMSYFLVKEAASFYLDAQESSLISYLKAGMVEGVAILFSFSRGKSIVLQWSQRVVVVLLCSLTLWTMTNKPVKAASLDVSKVRLMEEVIEELEGERIQKEALQKQFVQREWLGAARKYDKGLDEIRSKLSEARRELAKMQAPQIILNGLGLLISFRFLVVVANLICFHRLAEQLGLETEHK